MISLEEIESRNASSVAFSATAARGENPDILGTSEEAAASATLKSTITAARENTRRRSPRPCSQRSGRRRCASRPSRVSSLKLPDRAFQPADQHVNHPRRNRERRSDQNVIPAHAIHAALNRICHHAGLERVLLNPHGHARIRRKWCSSLRVTHEFNAKQRAHASNIANHRKSLQRVQRLAQLVAHHLHALEELFALDIIEHSIPRCHRYWMRVVRKAVQKRAGAARNRIHHVSRRDHRAQRGIPARDSLADQNHVRRHAPMFDRESFAGTSHPAHHFVRDQQNSVSAANLGQPLHVTFRRSHRTQGRARYRLEYESRDVLRSVALQHAIEFVGAIHIAFRITQAKWTPVAIARRNVPPFLKHRRERLATPHIARNRKRSQRAAVITLLPRKHAVTFLLAPFDPILAREFQRGLGGFGTAGSEIDAPILPHSTWGKRQNPRSELLGNGSLKLRGMNVGQPRALLRHRARNFLHAVPDGDDRRPARRVQITAPLRRINEASLRPHRLRISLQETSREYSLVRHWPPGDRRLCERSAPRFARALT